MRKLLSYWEKVFFRVRRRSEDAWSLTNDKTEYYGCYFRTGNRRLPTHSLTDDSHHCGLFTGAWVKESLNIHQYEFRPHLALHD